MKFWILGIIVVLGLGMWFLNNHKGSSLPGTFSTSTSSVTQGSSETNAVNFGKHITDALFSCDGGKHIGANFSERGVLLNLSDGRNFSLPQTVSASGARYANRSESFVFWNKGNTAFVEENGKMTYTNCSEVKAEVD